MKLIAWKNCLGNNQLHVEMDVKNSTHSLTPGQRVMCRWWSSDCLL